MLFPSASHISGLAPSFLLSLKQWNPLATRCHKKYHDLSFFGVSFGVGGATSRRAASAQDPGHKKPPTRGRPLASPRPAGVPGTASAGAEGRGLRLLVGSRSRGLSPEKFTSASFCARLAEVRLPSRVKWGLLSSCACSSPCCHYYLGKLGVQKSTDRSSVINILCKPAYRHSSANLQSLKI